MRTLLDLAKRYLLPYPDPLRRLRMRRAARALIICEPWPEEDAGAVDVAQLVLLRLLRIQREAHRTALVGGFEATMLLTRSAIETCITGLYWLHSDDATARLSGANAKAARRMMQFVGDLDPLLPPALDDLVRLIGEPEDLPKLWHMAQAVDGKSEGSLATELYLRLYVPLSTLYEHPTGVALLRHVSGGGRLSNTPDRFWSRRAALHVVDFCAAQIALAVAERLGVATEPFLSYAEAHMRRTTHPMISMVSRRALRGISLSRVPAAWRAASAMRSSFLNGDFAQMPAEERKERARVALDRILSVVELDLAPELKAQMIDRFSDLLADKAYLDGDA